MRASRALAVTATACAAVVLSTPSALAGNATSGGPSSVTINPQAVHQGGTMRITIEGCRRGGTVTSNAFPTVRFSGSQQGHQQGDQQGNQGGGNQGAGNQQGNQGAGNQQGNQGAGDQQGNQGGGNQQGNQGAGNQQGNQGAGNQQGNQGAQQGNQGAGNQQGNQGAGNQQGNQGAGNQQGNQGGGNQGAGSQRSNERNDQSRASVTVRIYDRATPGRYNLAVRCNDNSRSVTRQFTVLSGRGAQGGLGGSLGPSSTEMGVGAGLVAAAAVGGSVFIARRRRLNSGGI